MRFSQPITSAHGLPYSLRPGHGLRLPPAGGGSSGGIEPPKLPRADRAANPESSIYINSAAQRTEKPPGSKPGGRKEIYQGREHGAGPGGFAPNRFRVTVGLTANQTAQAGRARGGGNSPRAPHPRRAYARHGLLAGQFPHSVQQVLSVLKFLPELLVLSIQHHATLGADVVRKQ